MKTTPSDLQQAFNARFSDAPEVSSDISHDLLNSMASRGSCRSFTDAPVPPSLLQVLCATALSSPTKSDLQQRDIILLQLPTVRERLSALVGGQAWIADAPMIAVFCGNNHRQRLLHQWHEIDFANDHLDAFFNAATDAAVALSAFVTAAEALGLGCCPISAVRNEAPAVSELLSLPKHVFPFAGLALGYPASKPSITKRLPLSTTVHTDEYSEENLKAAVQSYDTDRAATQPYTQQRFTETFGISETYTWSEDKVRQYSQPERESFAEYVRAQGFNLT